MDDYYLDSPKITEEELRQYVRDKIDLLVPGGGFPSKAANPKTLKSSMIMQDELMKYTKDYYGVYK